MPTTTGTINLKAFESLYDNTQYFWFESNSSATYGAGVHITLSPESSFKTSPTGQNILINTDGMSIRYGVLPMMTLTNSALNFNTINTGAGTYTNIASFGANGMTLYSNDGNHTLIAVLGYGLGNPQTGSTQVDKPYYDLGVRSGTKGNYSVVEGNGNTASGYCSHAEGYYTTASGTFSHAEGGGTTASKDYSHAEGDDTIAGGDYSHAEGYHTTASGDFSHTEGDNTTASKDCSHAEGYHTTASEDYSHAEGYYTTASGYISHAEGSGTEASGEHSHAEGASTKATAYASHAEGDGTSASSRAHAEGNSTKATGYASHAEGGSTKASGTNSHAEGGATIASGVNSHAQNFFTVATESYQTVIGKYNSATRTGSGTSADPYVYSNVGDYAFIIGNGTDDDTASRSNALTVDWNGVVDSAGGFTIGGNKLFKVATCTKDNVSVAHTNVQSGTITPTAYTGYTPIGLLGYDFSTAGSSGAYPQVCYPWSMTFSNNVVSYQIRNCHASLDAKIKITARVLYVRSELI